MERRSHERGEVVYLTAEIRTEVGIHEIGARAEVRAVSDGQLELAFGASARDRAWCPAQHVVRAAERRGRMPSPSGRWLRPRVAPARGRPARVAGKPRRPRKETS